MNRREWIKLTAGAASGLAISACATRKLTPISATQEEWPNYTEKLIASACLQCDGGCGILARVVDGRVIKLEGNPLHPVNRGRLCPLGHAALQSLYNPDRIKSPLKRVGGKGSNKWVKLSWEEAIQSVADQLIELRQQGEPHSLVVFDGAGRGLMRMLVEQFCRAFGTPNHISTAQADGMIVAHELQQGISEPFAYDLEKADYILSFGCGLLDGWRSPVGIARTYGYLRQERPGAKAKIVQVERRFSTTAARADEWIPINPGAEGALALAIAYVIIREDLYDHEFVQNYTLGFDDWKDEQGATHQGFKSLVLKEYRPDDVAGITGIPVDTIIRLAKDFANTRLALAVADSNATGYVNGAYTALSIHALNALKGSIESPGGVVALEPVPFKPFPEIKADGSEKARVDRNGARVGLAAGSIELAAANIASSKPYPVRAAFLCSSNPLFDTRLESHFRQALDKIPLVVSFSSFADETSEVADLILPDHSFLEKWQDSIAPPLSGTPAFGIAQPAVEPLYDTMHTGDFLLKLGAAIGSPVSEALPWSDFKELLKSTAEGVYESGRGAVLSEPFEEAYQREMQQRGWATNEFSNYEEFWEQLTTKGGWTGLYHSYGRLGKVLSTASQKFEFYSHKLRSELEALARSNGKTIDQVLEDLKIQSRGDTAFLPHYEPINPSAPEKEYPLFLNPFDSLALASPDSANLPWIQESAGNQVGVKWDSWAEVNPATAAQLGIDDGESIWIESQRGRLKAKAKLYAGAMPNVINVPWGLGHKAFGRWAKDVGANPNTIIDVEDDPVSGMPAWFSTRVKVYKA